MAARKKLTEKQRKANAQNSLLSPINPELLYPMDTFHVLSGLGSHSVVQLQREGMPCYKIGNRKYVHGGDFIEYVRANHKSN